MTTSSLPTITAPPLAAQNRLSRVSFSERSDSGSRDRFSQQGQGRRRSSSATTGATGLRDESVTRASSRTRLISRVRGRRGSRRGSSSPTDEEKGKTGGKVGNRDGWFGLGSGSAWRARRDIRTRLPRPLQRFTGYRDPSHSPPYPSLPFPPFSYLSLIPIRYETYLLSTLGGIISILLIEIIMSTSPIFLDDGVPLIIASFGAGAVLMFGTIESPLAQPRHVLGGQVISALVGVGITKLFKLSGAWQVDEVTREGELGRVVWLSGAVGFGLAFLVMQVTGTVHPPGGATALIASVQPSVVRLGWRYVYIIAISSLIMIAWALIINNIGRRRYPHYWIHGTRSFVLDPTSKGGGNGRDGAAGKFVRSEDQVEMEVEEGRRGLEGTAVFGLDDLTEEPRVEGHDDDDDDDEGDEDEDVRGRSVRVGQRYS